MKSLSSDSTPQSLPAANYRKTCSGARLLGLSLVFLSFGWSVQAANDTWVGNISANWNTGTNWSGNAVPANGDTLVFGIPGSQGITVSTGAVSLTDDIASLTVGGSGIDGIDFNLNSAAYTIAPFSATITLNNSTSGFGINDLALTAQTISVPLTLGSTQTINVGSIDGSLTLSGVITGAAGIGITKTGSGLLTLTQSNAFGTAASPGTVTVQGGTLGVSNDLQLGPVPTAATAGELVLDGGTLRTTTGITINANRGIALGDSGASTGGTIDTAGQNTTYGGILANNGGVNSLTKVGSGTLTLFGVNTYTGNTVITQGQLTLDFNSAAAGVTSIINSSSTLTMGGSAGYTPGALNQAFPALFVQALSNVSETQSFNGLTLNRGTSEIAARGLGTGNATVSLGAITVNPGGSVAFSIDTNGAAGVGKFTTSRANAISTDGNSTTTGILGGWAVINPTATNNTTFQAPTDYAANVGGNIIAYTGYTALTTGATITSNTVANYQVTGTAAVALSAANGVTTDINTLSINSATTAAGATTVTIGTAGAGSTGILRLGAQGGFLIGTRTNANGGNAPQLIIGNVTGNGTLTAGGAANTAGTINLQLDQNLTINSNIADNGSGPVTLVINTYGSPNGNTVLILNGANNTYSGGTYINSGRVQGIQAGSFGTGAIYIGSMAQLDPATISNNIFIVGNSNSTFDTPSAIRGGGILSGTITLLGDAVLVASNTTYSGQITGNYNLNFGNTSNPGGAHSSVAILSNATNNWGGNLQINEGTVQLGASNVIPDGANTGNVILTQQGGGSAATLDLHAFNETINGLTGTTTVGQTTVKNTTAGNSVLTVGANNQTSTYNGLITDTSAAASLGITKTGSGILTLGDVANAYHGGTIINGGTVKLTAASGVANSDIGVITGALTVNTGGTLDLNSFSQTVGSLAGTGGVITSSTGGSPVLTVNNTNAGTTTFAGSIQNGSATVGLTLASTNVAILDLTAANTYTGATTISGGALQIGFGGGIAAASPVTLAGTSSLILGDGNGAVSQTLNSLSTIAGTSVVGGASSASTLTLNGIGTQTYATTFGGAGTNNNNLNLVISGTGTTPTSIFTALNSYIGTTTVNNGSTLNLSGGSIGSSALTLNSGGILTGVGNNSTTGLIGSLTAVGGSAITLTGASGTALRATGNITLGTTGAYNSSDYTTLNYTLAGAGLVEALNTPAVLTLNSGGAFVNITNPSTPGTYTLANYGSVVGGSGFSLSSTTAGVTSVSLGRNTETLTIGSTSLTLTIGGTPAPNIAYFNGKVSNVFNDLSNPTFVNFSTDQAGTVDAGNVPASNTNVFLVADNATDASHRNTTSIAATLGGSTILNSLNAISAAPSGLTSFTINQDSGQSYTLTLVGAATNGNTLGNGISLASGAAPLTINVPVVVGSTGANQTWTNNSSNGLTIGGAVTGSASVGNTQTLTLANTSTGGMTLNGVIANSAPGTLALVVNNTGAGITTLGGTNTYSGGTTLNGGTLTGTGTGAFGTGNITVNPNNVTGTAADNATLNSANSIASTAAVTVNSEAGDGGFGVGTINFNGSNPTIGSLAGNGNAVLNNAGGTTLTIGNATNNLSSIFSGVISNGAGTGSIIKAGTGMLTLSGPNTYSGSTTISSGTLQLGSANALPTNTLTGGANLVINTGAALDLNNFSVTLGAVPTGTGGVVTNGSATSGTSTLTFNNPTTVGTLLQTLTDSGATHGQLALALTSGTLTLSNSNSYTAGTSVGSGAILIDSSNGSGLGLNVAASIVNVNSGGNVTINVGGNNNYNYTFAGSGTAKFNFTGGGSDATTAITAFNGFTGTVELANPGNTGNKLVFGGDTGVSGATLKIDSGATAYITGGVNNFGAITLIGTGNSEGLGAIRIQGGPILGGNITLLGSATIGDGGGTITGNIASGVAGTQTLTIVNGAGSSSVGFTGNISDGSGQVGITENHGGGTTTLSGSNFFTGATTINAGTLKAGSANAFSAASAVTLANTSSANLDTTGFNTTIGSLAGGGTTGGNVILGAATLSIGANNTSTSYAGAISGSGGGLTKIGNGIQTLTGSNSYTGATTINSGTLKAGSTTAFSATSGVVMANTAGATLDTTGFNTTVGSLAGGGSTGGNVVLGAATLTTGSNGTSTSYSGVISGSGGVAKIGGGSQTLAGANTYTGGTTITSGAIVLGADTVDALTSALGSQSGALTMNGGTLDLNSHSQGVGALNGTGVITDANQSTTVTSTLTVGNGNATGSYAGVINGDGLTTGNDIIALTKVGTGTQTLAGQNTYGGDTSIQNGTLNLVGSIGSAGNITVGTSTTPGLAPTLTGGVTSGATTNGGQGYSFYTPSATVGSITGNLTVNGTAGSGSAGILTPGALSAGSGTPGTLTVGSVTLNAGSISNFVFDSTNSINSLVSTGALSIDGGAGIDLYTTGGTGAAAFSINGTYDLFQYSSGLTGNFTNNTSVLNAVAGKTYTFGSDGTYVTLTIANAITSGTTPTTYTLASSATNPNVLVSNTTSVAATITNSGSGSADTLNYTGLTASATGGSVSGSATNGGPLGQGVSGTNSGLSYAAGATSGTFAVTPTVGSATNATIGGAATNNGTTPVNVFVYDRANLSGTGLQVQNSTVGALTASALLQSVTIVSGSSQAGFTAVTPSGQRVDPGAAGTNATVASFSAPANSLNGTYNGVATVGFNDVTGSGAGIVGGTGDAKNIAITGTVSGQVGAPGVAYSAGILQGGSYAGYGLTSGGAKGTVATLLGGTASGATTVNMTFNNAPNGHPANPYVSSDVLTLSGIKPTGSTGPDGSILTDQFVLQLSYSVNPAVGSNPYYIGWFDVAAGPSGSWVNAVAGNSNAILPGAYFGGGGFTESYAAYLSSHGGTPTLGAYGYDPTNQQAWAVLDHNSDFTVVPEPGTYAMILSGFGMLIGIQKLRKRRVGV